MNLIFLSVNIIIVFGLQSTRYLHFIVQQPNGTILHKKKIEKKRFFTNSTNIFFKQIYCSTYYILKLIILLCKENAYKFYDHAFVD